MNKFLKEIFEQPEAIENTLNYYTASDGLSSLESVKNEIIGKKFKQIIFTGMGSSYFVSHAASIMFNELKINSFVLNASELLHYNLQLLEHRTLLICISQSGESFEILEILKRLPSDTCCVGVTNEENSTLAKKANIVLLCKGGKEEMTSTKTYMLTSIVPFILGWYLAGIWNEEKIGAVKRLAENVRTILTGYNSWMPEALDFLGDLQSLQVIARGPSFSTASQTALMFKEATKIPATGISGGEFRHGPMEMVSKGFKAILYATKGKTFGQSMKMAEDIAGYGGKVLLLTNEKLRFTTRNVMQIHIDEPDEYLFSVNSIVPMQLFVDSYAKSKGFSAGSFSRGAKVTEIE